MGKIDSQLDKLFSLSRDAVLGLRGGCVAFANAAACERFGARVGLPGECLLPAYVLEEAGESFVCVVPKGAESLTVCGTRQEGLLLLCIQSAVQRAPSIPAGILAQLRQSAYNLRMASELIAGGETRNGGSKAYSPILRRNYYALTRLLRNLTDVDALGRGELQLHREATDLHKLYRTLTESAAQLLADRGVALRFESAPGCYCLMADRERMESLLLNLIANAIGHCERGGKVCVALSRQGEHLILAVDDNGSGIPPARLATLFALREGGLADADSAGLGLLLAQGIAQGHGGAMIVQSDAGCGTRVRVRLPAEENLLLRDDANEAPGAGILLMELASVLDLKLYDNRYTD